VLRAPGGFALWVVVVEGRGPETTCFRRVRRVAFMQTEQVRTNAPGTLHWHATLAHHPGAPPPGRTTSNTPTCVHAAPPPPLPRL
jgi:hypothetical protein